MASGFLCVVKSLAFSSSIFSRQEVEVGRWANENTPIDAIFLAMKYPGIPVTSISGRTGLMTFPGWAWTHGIYNVNRTILVNQMWETADPNLFMKSGTRYALRLLARQTHKWQTNPSDTRWMKVFASPAIEVWEIVCPLITQADWSQ
jgi:hypothetical protein